MAAVLYGTLAFWSITFPLSSSPCRPTHRTHTHIRSLCFQLLFLICSDETFRSCVERRERMGDMWNDPHSRTTHASYFLIWLMMIIWFPVFYYFIILYFEYLLETSHAGTSAGRGIAHPEHAESPSQSRGPAASGNHVCREWSPVQGSGHSPGDGQSMYYNYILYDMPSYYNLTREGYRWWWQIWGSK